MRPNDNSNTTLVNVKYKMFKITMHITLNSNTTLVNVKLHLTIYLKHLMGNSNTTLVNVKWVQDMGQ